MEGFSVPFFGFLLGILVFLAIYGVEPLRVTGSGWIFQGVIESDILQHYAGWMFFRDSPWTWPLGLALNMGYPYGANISYTDSIPIVSIFFKAIPPGCLNIFNFSVFIRCSALRCKGLPLLYCFVCSPKKKFQHYWELQYSCFPPA
jgi:hypothetical protein